MRSQGGARSELEAHVSGRIDVTLMRIERQLAGKETGTRVEWSG